MIGLDRDLIEIESLNDKDNARKLSLAIEEFVRQKTQNAWDSAQKLYTTFISEVDSQTSRFDEVLTNEDPIQIVSNSEKLKTFERLRDHEYPGPFFLNANSDWAELINIAIDAANLSELTQDQDLHPVLLKRIFYDSNYTLAHARRDLRLLQLAPPQRIKEAEDLSSKLDELALKANQYADVARKLTEDAKSRTNSVIQRRFDEFKKTILVRHEEECKRRQEIRAKLLSQVSSIRFTDDSLKLLGDRFENYAKGKSVLFKSNLHNYLTINEDPSLYDIATLSEFDFAEAFSNLIKQSNSFLPKEFRKQASRVDQIKLVDFDYDRFSNDVASDREALNHALSNYTVTIRNRELDKDNRVTLTLAQLRAERADVIAHPPKFITKSGPHDTERSYWSYDPEYLNRINSAISTKEAEIRNRFQIHRKIEVISCGH